MCLQCATVTHTFQAWEPYEHDLGEHLSAAVLMPLLQAVMLSHLQASGHSPLVGGPLSRTRWATQAKPAFIGKATHYLHATQYTFFCRCAKEFSRKAARPDRSREVKIPVN